MRNSEAKKTMNLLRQALNTAQGSDLLETRKSIQQAMSKLEMAMNRRFDNRTQAETQREKWWNTVVSGVAKGPISSMSAMRALKQLNAMTDKEEKIIDTIEQQVQTPTTLLQD